MNPKIKAVTVTLNPCLDRLVTIPPLVRGGMNRIISSRTDPAGKGLNVSVALKSLGIDSLCTGFNYRDNGQILTDNLDALGVAHDFITADGAVRTNIKLVERDTRTMTEINEPGAEINAEQVSELIKKVSALDGDVLILSGSRPKGVSEDIFARLINEWKGRAFLDTEGAALLAAVYSERPPFLIKPNTFELETAFNVKLPDTGSIIKLCRKELCGRVEMICVSMGGDGALLVTADGAWFAPALDIPVRGLAGAGDSMVAGLTAGILRNAPPEEILRMGAAAASASVIREGTQLCTREGFNEMMGRVTVNFV